MTINSPPRLLRRFLIVLMWSTAALSLGVAVVTGVAWFRGGWTSNSFHPWTRYWESVTDGNVSSDLIQVIIVRHWSKPLVGPPGVSGGPALDQFLNRPFHFWFQSGNFGLHYWVEPGTWTSNTGAILGNRLDVDASFEGAIAVLLILPVIVFVMMPIRQSGMRRIKRVAKRIIADSLISKDLLCVGCGYNLRTQAADGRCPECGSPVIHSLAPDDDLAKTCKSWLIWLAMGDVLLFLSRAILAVTFALIFQRNGGFVAEYLPAACGAGADVIVYAGGNLSSDGPRTRKHACVWPQGGTPAARRRRGRPGLHCRWSG